MFERVVDVVDAQDHTLRFVRLVLCSELASGITGEILYVDAGYSIVGG